MELKKLRARIDKIDQEILRLIRKRISYMPAIAAYKKKNHLPLYQAQREAEIIASRSALAKKLGVDSALIKKIFVALMKSSRKIQGHNNRPSLLIRKREQHKS